MPASWTSRIWQEFRAHQLTRSERDVLLTLHTFRSAGGVAWPSHATLADRSGTSPSTVLRALKQARELGLVHWVERRVRAGWRWLRTSNLYRFLTPDGAVLARRRVRNLPHMRIFPNANTGPATNRQWDGGGEIEGRKSALEAVLAAARAMPDLLAMRRAAMEGR